MQLFREQSPLMELLIRLLVVTVVAAAVFSFSASWSWPAMHTATERNSETTLRDGACQ